MKFMEWFLKTCQNKKFLLVKIEIIKIFKLKGWIYKISHKRKKDGKNLFPSFCYIGQHRGKDINERFRQHKNDAKNFERKEIKDKEGKHARLHEAMRISNPENFFIEELEQFEHSDEISLINILNKAELEYIRQFNSIEDGWNTVDAPQIKRIRNSGEKSLAQYARENEISYNSLRHRVNNMGEKIQEAINHLKEYRDAPLIKYEYKRQIFENIRKISESKLHNKNNLDKKTIEKRIRDLKKSNKLKIKIENNKNEKIYVLIDEIFKSIKEKKIYSVETPDGEIKSGLIIELHKILHKKYPDSVPEKYTTIQSRLKKDNWSVQQAFGFEYPPDLIDVKSLIEIQGYKWAVEKPNFIRQNGKPVIMHSDKEIFATQEEFCEAYNFKSDLVSDYIVAGKTPEEIRDYFWGKNN